MKTKNLIIVALLLLCSSCGQSLEEKMNQKFSTMREMAELGTVEYTIRKIVMADDEAFYTVGDRKILFSCQATMKAGISLADFNVENVKVNEAEKSVEVALPKAKVLAFNMPAEKIKLEYEKVGTFRSNFTADDRNNLLRQGEKAILDDAANLGILKDAEENARVFFETLLKQVGFETVNVKFI